MKETMIFEQKKIKRKLRNPILLIGLPGIGLIGQVVGKYIVKELNAKQIAVLFSPYFPHQVLMSRKGTMRLIKNAFYMYNAKKFDLIILVGDIQAMSSVGQYEVAGKILDYAKKLGVKKIIAVGGYSTGVVTEKRRIFGVVTAPEEINELKKMGVVFGEAKGSIVGSAGLIPALGALRGIKGICLLGETHGGYVDTITAKEVVALLSTYLGIEINLKKIDERAKKSEKIIKRLEEEIKRNIETSFGQEPSKISYIR